MTNTKYHGINVFDGCISRALLFVLSLMLFGGYAAFSQQMPERSAESAVPEVGIQKGATPDISPQRQLFAAYRLGMKEYQAPKEPHGLGRGISEGLTKVAFYGGLIILGLLVFFIGRSSGWF